MTTAHRPISFKLRPEERSALHAAASNAGIGISTFAAEAVRKSIGTSRRHPLRREPTALVAAIREATVAVGRIGNLANQMARHSHTGGRVDAEALDRLRNLLAAIDARLDAASR